MDNTAKNLRALLDAGCFPTQREMARIGDISAPFLHDILSGKRGLEKEGVIERIAAAARVHPDDITRGDVTAVLAARGGK